MSQIFDGYSLAEQKLEQVKSRVEQLQLAAIKPKIAAILFTQDKGSELYTGLKADAAKKVGIEYQAFPFDISSGVEEIQNQIKQLNQDKSVTGIIVQKPTRKVWAAANYLPADQPKAIRKAFQTWWQLLVSQIEPQKDVDGLHPSILQLIKEQQVEKEHRVYPATMSAVLSILEFWLGADYLTELQNKKIIILGKSDLLGQPLNQYFQAHQLTVSMIGSGELKERITRNVGLQDADVIISTTGRKNLITGDLVKEGVMAIDVGEPASDIDFASVAPKAKFITPVPGGVGPMTVACLMENCVKLTR